MTSNDIGQMTKVCGVISNIEISKYGEMFVSFKDQRLNNIKISQVQICVYIHLPAMLVRLCCLYLQEI